MQINIFCLVLWFTISFKGNHKLKFSNANYLLHLYLLADCYSCHDHFIQLSHHPHSKFNFYSGICIASLHRVA